MPLIDYTGRGPGLRTLRCGEPQTAGEFLEARARNLLVRGHLDEMSGRKVIPGMRHRGRVICANLGIRQIDATSVDRR